MSVSNLLGDIISILNSKEISIFWLHEGQTMRNFSYNCNIRDQDDQGLDLELKSAETICEEMSHCGNEIICMLYTSSSNLNSDHQILFFDSLD